MNKRLAALLEHLLDAVLLRAYQQSATRYHLFSTSTPRAESLVAHLVRLGIDLNTVDCNCGASGDCGCWPALHHAISHSNETMVRSLLNHGARINVAYNSNGDNAVHLAIDTIDRNTGLTKTPQDVNMVILRMLLGGGGLQTMNDAACLNRVGLSWLNMAVRFCPPKNMTIVEPFLVPGISVDVAHRLDQWTPLHVAVSNHRGELVAALLALGADHRTVNSHGKSPFATACNPLYCGLVDLFLRCDVTLVDEVLDEQGETVEQCVQRSLDTWISLKSRGDGERRNYYRGQLEIRSQLVEKLRKLAQARRDSSMSDSDLQIYWNTL